MWLLCTNPYQWKPENEWLTNPLLRSRYSTDILFTTKWESGIREETSHWHGVLAQIVNLILQGRLFIGHQVTVYQVRKKQGSEQTCCCKEISQFSGLLDIPVRQDGLQMQMNILLLQLTVVRMMQSLSVWNFKTRGTIRRMFPSTLWFYKRMYSSQLHRWQNSQPPPTQSAKYAQQALAYLERHSGLSDGISVPQRDFCAQAHDREHRCSCEAGLNGLSD